MLLTRIWWISGLTPDECAYALDAPLAVVLQWMDGLEADDTRLPRLRDLFTLLEGLEKGQPLHLETFLRTSFNGRTPLDLIHDGQHREVESLFSAFWPPPLPPLRHLKAAEIREIIPDGEPILACVSPACD